jgi:hypothetical protein
MLEGKHNEIVSENDDGSMCVENTKHLFHFEQTNTPDKSYIKNKKKKNYDEIAYLFSQRIKIKHEPEAEADPETKPVQYAADIIVEIKNRDGTVVPMRALLDAGTTSTIILREFVGKGRSHTNTKKNQVGNTRRYFHYNYHYQSLLDFSFQEISTSKVLTWQARVDHHKTSSKGSGI